MSALERVGVVVHSGRREAVRAAEELVGWFRDRGITTRTLDGEPLAGDEGADRDAFAAGLDLVVSVGGDGTLLRAAQLARRSGAPLLGVKVGRLGFLTEVGPEDAPAVLEQVADGSVEIEQRLAVEASPLGAESNDRQWALNEIIVEKTARHRLVTLAARVGEEYVTTFSADGVIVATPTGSTAYSFSARGPIVVPDVDCLVLTAVSPHMVFDHSIVLPPRAGVTLEVLGEEPALLSADGQPGLALPVGGKVRIVPSDQPARLVRRAGSPTFFSLLREKFSLPGKPPPGDQRGDVASA